MNRREFLGTIPAGIRLASQPARSIAQSPKKGVMLMNRIGPSISELYIANRDGTNERKFLSESAFYYHPSYAPDGQWVVFTSERIGDGQSDIFRWRPDGRGIEPLAVAPSIDDAGVLSPDGSRLAFVSTRDGYKANIWVLELETRRLRNLTGGKETHGDPGGADCRFRPAWSPDGQWLTFSSDRNTPWRGHSDGHGWEHTQELSVYVIRPDGTGFRRIASRGGVSVRRNGRRTVAASRSTSCQQKRRGVLVDRIWSRKWNRRWSRSMSRAESASSTAPGRV